MPNAYINSYTQQRLNILVKDLPQSIVFTGPEGVGLSSAISYVTAFLHAMPIYVLPEKDDKVDIERGVITVDTIRRLYSMTKTIETRKRLIVIDYAERMGARAQNAFLKLLEEPGENTHFILLTHTLSSLLPTVRSRVQAVEVKPVTNEQSEALLTELKVSDATRRSQLLFIAAGRPAHLTLLATNEKAFEARAKIVRDARTFLQGTMYDRLKIALSYKDNRQDSLTLLLDAMNQLKDSLQKGTNPEQVRKLSTLLIVHQRIEANGNVRLQLASVVL